MAEANHPVSITLTISSLHKKREDHQCLVLYIQQQVGSGTAVMS